MNLIKIVFFVKVTLYPDLLPNFCKNKYYNIKFCYYKFLRVQKQKKDTPDLDWRKFT